MLSRFLQSTRALLFQNPVPTIPTFQSAATEAQIQAELAEAALEGMVTTRKQSHVFSEAELKDGSEIETPRAHAKKRKTGDGTAATPDDLLAKRRRKSSASGTIVVATPVKANGTRKPTSASKDFDKASDATLESDSHERNGRREKRTANDDEPTLEVGSDTKGVRAAASKSPAGYVGNDTHKSQQTVAVVIESKPIDSKNMEDGSSNKQASSGKKDRRNGDSPVDLAATVRSTDDSTKTSIASSREDPKKFAGGELDISLVEQPNNELSSSTQVLKKQPQNRKGGSTSTPKASQKGSISKGFRSIPGQQLDRVGSTGAPNGEERARKMDGTASAPKATHKRFASEESEPFQRPKAQEHSTPHDEDDASVVVEDSDDDAPEILTASASLKQVRATAIEAARALEKYDGFNVFYSYKVQANHLQTRSYNQGETKSP